MNFQSSIALDIHSKKGNNYFIKRLYGIIKVLNVSNKLSRIQRWDQHQRPVPPPTPISGRHHLQRQQGPLRKSSKTHRKMRKRNSIESFLN